MADLPKIRKGQTDVKLDFGPAADLAGWDRDALERRPGPGAIGSGGSPRAPA
jgi:hypothetical protein